MGNEVFGGGSSGFMGMGMGGFTGPRVIHNDTGECCGGRHEFMLEGYKYCIESDELVSFSFSDKNVSVYCCIEDGKLVITSNGGNSSRRDGTLFKLRYYTEDMSILAKLNKIIKDYDMAKSNGYSCTVDGLPGGCGDSISAEYASGEKLYMYSNQLPTVNYEAAKLIYDTFHEEALKNGLDFNTAGSNVQLYDDADEKFLQGSWKGRHFGREILAEFEGSHVRIYVDGKPTDDTEYILYDGNIRPNKLKEGVAEPKSEHDYVEFEGCSCMRKKNKICLTAYFMKESYSTCDLITQKE